GFDYLNRLAVDGHFNFGNSVVVRNAASTTHLGRIYAVEREVVAEGQPTRGTERQVVRTTAGCAPIRGGRRADRWIAHGQAADLGPGRNIAVHQGRRHLEHVGDIVEALGGIVGGKEGGHVYIQSQQVADRVAIFIAV